MRGDLTVILSRREMEFKKKVSREGAKNAKKKAKIAKVFVPFFAF